MMVLRKIPLDAVRRAKESFVPITIIDFHLRNRPTAMPSPSMTSRGLVSPPMRFLPFGGGAGQQSTARRPPAGQAHPVPSAR